MAGASFQKTASFIMVAGICIASTRIWSSLLVPTSIFSLLEWANAFLLLGVVVYNYRKFPLKNTQFSTQASLFFIIPFVSAISAYVFHYQSYIHSLLSLKYNFLWLLYFALHLLNLPVKKLQHLMFFIGGVWILLTVVQQFTYPTYFFSTRSEETSYDFYRAGVYRYMIDDHHYNLFILFFFFYRFLLTKKIWYVIPAFFALVGFYYFGTRQFALAAIVCSVIIALAQKGRTRVYSVIFMGVMAMILISLKEILFGGYIEMTKEQVGADDDDIRLLASNFFLFEYWPHWLATIIGNGQEHLESAYGIEMYYINKVLLFYRADIGVIGAFNSFGIFYVINIIVLNVKGLKSKYYTKNTQYLRLFFLNALLLLIISEYYAYQSAIPYFCIILYMVDKSFEEKKEERRATLNRKKEQLAIV